MQFFHAFRRATLAVALGVAATGTAVADPGSTSPQPSPTPAYIFLDVPAAGSLVSQEYAVRALSYDSETHVERPGDKPVVFIKGTLTLIKAGMPAPMTVGQSFATLFIRQADGAKATMQTTTFHGFKVASVAPDDDQPTVQLTFTAVSVNVS